MHKTIKTQEDWGRPYFSLTSVLCLILSYPISVLLAEWFKNPQDYYGIGAVFIMILTIVTFLVVGLLLGVTAIYRNEKPKKLPLFATTLNFIGIIVIILLAAPLFL